MMSNNCNIFVSPVLFSRSSNRVKGESRAAATHYMERFVIIVNSLERILIIVNGYSPLTIITKRSMLDVAAVLDPPPHILAHSSHQTHSIKNRLISQK